MKKSTTVTSWVFRILILIVMLMTLPAKLSSDPTVVALFTELGVEPFGRYLVASLELLAAILILIPAFKIYGAGIAAGLMSGALMGHITKLGFAGERASLAVFAVVTLISSLGLLFIHRKSIPVIGKALLAKA